MRTCEDRRVTAIRPDREPLVGRFIRLEPLTTEHLPALFRAIAHPIVFAGGYGGGPAGYRGTLDGFTTFAEQYYAWERNNVYAVIVTGGPHDGELVGTTTLGDFVPQDESAHIGWTAYDPRVWGTAVNAEAKLLLLELAFSSGFGRVKIQADALNDRSRAAIHRLGATFEGVIRRDKARADGSWRDTALFSVIVEDWPGVCAQLTERLDAHAGHPVMFREFPRSAQRG